MKNFLLRLVCALCLTVLSAFAAFAASDGYTGPGAAPPAPQSAAGGYTGPGPALSTVKEAEQMRDDSHATLRGTIERHLGKKKYLFRDASGTITVKIDHDKWAGQSVGAADLVEIQGEVDKDWNSVEIEVKKITKLAK